MSLNNRILALNLTTGETHEFVYVVDAIGQGRGVNELLAINDHEFLVLERDNQTNIPTPTGAPPEGVPGKSTPAEKRIYRIDLNELNGGALPTDVANQDTLPATFTPVKKHLFIDMLNPAYQVDATHTLKDVVPEKMEGMAWGPDLPRRPPRPLRRQRQRPVRRWSNLRGSERQSRNRFQRQLHERASDPDLRLRGQRV